MGNIFTDIATAVKLTGEVRKARRAGASGVRVKPVYTVPLFKCSSWGFTMEFCLFYQREKWGAIWDVFETFDEETQHALTFSPKDGEWANRARFWQEKLRPALPPKQYHAAMLIILHHYARCVRRRKEAAA